MSCEAYLDLISASLDGELTQQEQAQLTAHLEVCPACRAILNDMQAARDAFAHVGEVEAPEGLARGVMAQIRQERRKKRRLFHQLAGLAACLVMCVGVIRITDATISDLERQRGADTPMPLSLAQEHYAFSNQRQLDVTYGSTPEAPGARIIGSQAALSAFLAQFPQDDLSALQAMYEDAFFTSGRLLAVVVEEPTGGVRHTLDEQRLLDHQVTVIRQVPQVADCVMTARLIVAEVGDAFRDGQTLDVVFSE